jgi:DNA-binding transcriptional LysR family regulator
MAQHPSLDVNLLRSFLQSNNPAVSPEQQKTLGRSQPAISLQIKRLEDRAGRHTF